MNVFVKSNEQNDACINSAMARKGRMKSKYLRLALLFVIYHLSFIQAIAQSPRQVISMDDGWRFHLGDVQNAERADYNDAAWRTVDLPHDFQIEQPWVEPDPSERPDNTDVAANIRSRLSSRGFKEMGRAWYRKTFTPDDALRGKRLTLDFGGIMYVGDVYLNGKLVGGTDYGYVGFEIDITQDIKWGAPNVIAVMADTREPNNSRWYTGGGLFRGVRLFATDAQLYFNRHPLYITTSPLAGQGWSVRISADVACRAKQNPPTVDISVRISDPQGNVVAEHHEQVKHNRNQRSEELRLPDISIANAQLWDCEHPNLYTAVVTLYDADGHATDQVSEHFGLRTVEFGPEFGMKLNGKKVLLKGYANHHSLGALGAAAYPDAIEKRIRLMKQFGINHIRTSHNPYSREFIELCDKHGILVVDELYDKWTRQHTGGRTSFENHWQNDVPEWVKRDRNSPSVVLWSLGNELQQDPNQPFNDWGVTVYKLQKTLLQRYDSTRLVTVAMHPRYRNWETDSLPCDLAMNTDIQAYNYRYMYFPGDGRRFPWMTFYQSEASISAMGPNFFEMDLNKVIGLAYWGAIDYLGESQGWPAKGWAQGVFDLSLEPKPKAFFMKSFLKPDEPLVHIAVIDSKQDIEWNGIQTGNDGMSDHWNRRAGQKLTLVTYTNADEVELLLNGRSLGSKQNPKSDTKHRNQIRWEDIEYQDGRLEAIARTNGAIVARHKIETAGKATRLVATIEDAADGAGLVHIRIHAVDAKGRRVYSAQDELQFSIEGDARIVAVGNGDITSNELHTPAADGRSAHRRLYNGSAQVILRVTDNHGPFTLRTSSAAFKTVATKWQRKK